MQFSFDTIRSSGCKKILVPIKGQGEEIVVSNRVLIQSLKSSRPLELLVKEGTKFDLEVVETSQLYRYGDGPEDFLMNAVLFRYNPK